jgi:Carboxypeptidase regulatory-like domain
MPGALPLLMATFLGLSTAATAAAQTNGSIAGVVLDASGAPIAGATVSLESSGQQLRSAQTGADGRFSIEGAAGGETLMRVRAGGFAESVASVQTLSTPVRPQVPLYHIGAGVID